MLNENYVIKFRFLTKISFAYKNSTFEKNSNFAKKFETKLNIFYNSVRQ